MRLDRIIRLIKTNSTIIDVGSDHAYLAIKLLTKNQAKYIYNIEINKTPLENGIKNLKKYKLLDCTKNIINNGLEKLKIKTRIDYCVIAGMGGKNIINIIENKSKDLKINNFILVPNNNSCSLRKYLYSKKYKFEYEEIIKEHTHFYELMLVNKTSGVNATNEIKQYFGPYNLKHKTKTFKEYCAYKLKYFDSNTNLLKNPYKQKELDLLKKIKPTL